MVSSSRRQKLKEVYRTHFGSVEGTELLRAPGRVNLIGEHTDYNGLPVLPMAISQDIVVMFRPGLKRTIRVADVAEEFGSREFDIAEHIHPFSRGDWGNYVKAGVQALVKELGILNGFDAVISGMIPRDAGLSSSSAMVVASALALLRSNRRTIDPLRLMDLLAAGEQYVGTRGGGMDQAACLGGRPHRALRIDFFPLRLRAYPIPDDWRFVVAHSLVRARKSGEALEQYNRRPAECREALSKINQALPHQGNKTYPQLLEVYPETALLEAAQHALAGPLLDRFRHVVTEGRRVGEATEAMEQGDIERFGRLMFASHESLRNDYQVSCPELDTLVECCQECGATGARMTGAGFGGCVVALCRRGFADQLLSSLQETYYQGRSRPEGLPDYIFVVTPSSGAAVLER